MIREDCPELIAAAKWWAAVLRADPPKDTGDAFLDAALSRFSTASPITDAQLAVFERAVRERVAAAWNVDGWLVGGWEQAEREGNPNIGSGNRVIATDYHPEGPLMKAANDAGISDLRFPVKTVMWVSPGHVRVAHGYRARPVTIYPVDASEETP